MRIKLDSDGAVDDAVAGVGRGARAMHDAAAQAEFDKFVAGLAHWRAVRDQQLLPAVQRGDLSAARDVVGGALAKADDAFAAPLDKFVERVAARTAPAQAAAARTTSSNRTIVIVALLLGVAMAVALAVVVGRMIVRPVRAVSQMLARLATGDVTGSVDIAGGDEVGQMATALDTATSNLRSTLVAITESAGTLAAATEQMSATNEQIAASAEQTSSEAAVVSGAAGEINSSMSGAANGAEELRASIQEIAHNAKKAAEVAAAAVRSAQVATATMTQLGQSSEQISAVVKTVTTIAEQTNLLASTPPSRPRVRARQARASPWSPTRSRTWRRKPRGPPRTSPSASSGSRTTRAARSTRSTRSGQ
jgi:methyl-accepting chemotaxis protein